MNLREWLVTHLPAWLLPVSPWGAKGRPDLPEKHAVVNRQQAVQLRLDRWERLQARARLDEWREQHGG